MDNEIHSLSRCWVDYDTPSIKSTGITLACPEETAAWITAALTLSTTFLSSTAGNGESDGVLHLHERMANLQQAVPVPGMSIKNNDKIVIYF